MAISCRRMLEYTKRVLRYVTGSLLTRPVLQTPRNLASRDDISLGDSAELDRYTRRLVYLVCYSDIN